MFLFFSTAQHIISFCGFTSIYPTNAPRKHKYTPSGNLYYLSILKVLFKPCKWQISTNVEFYLILTRTTRTPAFWRYPPPPHDYPYYWAVHFESQVHTIDQFISDPKSKQGESWKIRNTCDKLKFLNFVINLTRDTPSNGSDYLWQIWK